MLRNLIHMHMRKFELIRRVTKSRADEGSLRDRVVNNIHTLDLPFQVIFFYKNPTLNELFEISNDNLSLLASF